MTTTPSHHRGSAGGSARTILALALAAPLALAACGGGGGSPVVVPKLLTLADGVQVRAGSYRLTQAQITAISTALDGGSTVPAGGIDLGGLTLRCEAPPCTVTVTGTTVTLTGTLVAMTTPPPGGTTPDGGTPPVTPATPSGGGGGGGGTGTDDSGGDETTEDGNQPAPTALRGILWDDDSNPATPDVQYEFRTTYTIPGVDDGGRLTYITNTVKRDGEYARRTAIDISKMISEIREGKDHEWTGLSDDDLLARSRVADQYGHTPGSGPEELSLKAFVDAGDQGVAVLVAARGVSKGIAAAAWADVVAIRRLIAQEYDRYIDKARAAKDALEAEADRLRRVEIPALVGTDGDGGSVKAARDEADGLRTELSGLPLPALSEVDRGAREDEVAALDTEIAALDREIAALGTEIDDLTAEINALNEWIQAVDLFNIPAGCSDLSSCITLGSKKLTERKTKQDERTTKQGERKTKQDERTTKQGEIDTSKMRQDAIDAKQEEIDGKVAEADADEQRAAALEAEADRLVNTDAEDIQGEIADIQNEVARARQILAGNPNDPSDRGDIAELRTILGSLDPTEARLESEKARRVRTYLEGAFERRASSADVLLGLGANFVTLTEQAAGGSVFGRAPMPAGTVDVWKALGLEEGRGGRTIDTMINGLEDSNLAVLDDQIGDHRALALSGKPATADFTLADPANDQASYDGATQASGNHYKGTWKGVHGTLYLDRGVWYFTPTTDRKGQTELRGKDPELFRYRANGDGTFELVGYVDYGLWMSDEGTLSLNLLAGVVGPQGAGDLGTDVDVTTAHNDQSSTLARSGLLPPSATYSGTAAGLSAITDREGTSASGHFTADVKLTATFGADPMLGGTIDNFQSADPDRQGTAHVGTDWVLTLDQTGLTAFDHDNDGTGEASTAHTGGRLINGGISGDGVTGGEWSATAYGTEELRPEGFFGGFRAEGMDGDATAAAAGVFHAKTE